MPLRKPHKGESQTDWMEYCMHELATSETDRPQDQMVAICMTQWREHTGEKSQDFSAWRARIKEILAKQAPSPKKGETYDGYMSRCKKNNDEHECETKWNEWVRGQEQHPGPWDPSSEHGIEAQIQRIIARCRLIELQDNGNGKEVPEPDEDESKSDFMDRCTNELSDDMDDDDAEDACEMAWEDFQQERSARAVVHKTHEKNAPGMEFVMSDATPDRFGDVVDPHGWETTNFKRNPVALFSHDSQFIVGRWRNVRNDHQALRGDLDLAPPGTSPRIDEIRKLVEADILKAVSVGFKPIESEPIEGKKGGTRYKRHELVECSLVAIPANPNALSVVRSLHISPEIQRLVFGEHASRKTSRSVRGEHASKRTRTATGEHAADQIIIRGVSVMQTLSQRIEDTRARIVDNTDKLTEHYEKMDPSNVSDADMEITQRLNAEIARDRKQEAMLLESERVLGQTANGDHRALVVRTDPPARNGGSNGSDRLFTPDNKKGLDRQAIMDAFMRAGVVAYFSKIYGRGPEEMRQRIVSEGYGHYGDESVKMACDMVFRAAVSPAQTTVAGWAAELVQITYAAFLDLLYPKSIFPRLSAKGLALSFGRAGKIIIPARAATPTIAGSFVGEGLPIPVRQAGFTTITLVPKKLAVISTMTREISEHSIPAIEGLIRDAIGTDTAIAIDSVLIDTNPATAVRPAGLLNGVTPITATAGGGVAAVVGDFKALTNALIAATKGNIRAPCYLMNPGNVNNLIWTPAIAAGVPTGLFPFRDEVKAGNLGGWPIIDSGTVPLNTVIAVDAADFVTAGADAPMWNVSDVATIHEEDTAPLPIVAGGTPATPVRSLWQTDSIGIRMIMMLNWTMRRAGMVASVSGVTW